MNGRLRNNLLSIAAAMAIASGGAAKATANNHTIERKSEQRRQFVGVVVDINKEARTMTVREFGGKRLYAVEVPLDKQIILSPASPTGSQRRTVAFEQLMRGFIVDLQIAQSRSAR